ncbi:hypothetical protein [Halobacteriovorax sp. JY17]|uniref:hypothetical protein n=1 Tax=Halobacteriovorax sp. JY17 TaxID=2014617 RepID=UPI000C492A66|nr:hypothetical protein [Halobacteriovorax sp. JY17]PIK15016.1 MAG: hypothetical protein CES88_11830 [Halobacteriovorax sp. JY17]
MKVLTIFVTLMSSTFAQDYQYKLISSDTTDCPQEMLLTEKENQISLTLSDVMGAYFNKDSAEGEVVIENINEGAQVHRDMNTSHGTRTKTKYNAERNNNRIFVSKEIKFGRLGAAKSKSQLHLEFTGSRLVIDTYRSYSEKFGTSWEKENYCAYREVE